MNTIFLYHGQRASKQVCIIVIKYVIVPVQHHPLLFSSPDHGIYIATQGTLPCISGGKKHAIFMMPWYFF